MGPMRRLFVLASLLVPACGDDVDPPAGTDSVDASGSDPSGVDSSGGNAECDATPRDVIPLGTDVLSGVTIAGDRLVMLVTDGTLMAPPRIDAIGLDGSGRTTLFTGTASITITSVFAHGDSAYFMQRDYADPVPLDTLMRVPTAGGTAEPVGAVALETATIVDVDDGGVYITRSTMMPVGTVFERVDPGTGALTTMGTSVDTGTPLQVHGSADRIVFHVGGVGGAAGDPSQVMGLAKDATGATPTLLWATDPTDDPCGLPLGGLFPTPTKIACGFSAVAIRELDGTMPEVLIERDMLGPLNVLVATDAENLYVIDTVPVTEQTGHMFRLATLDPTVVPVACDIGKVAYALVDGSFPNQTEYEVVVGATEVFWVEERLDDAGLRYALRAIAK